MTLACAILIGAPSKSFTLGKLANHLAVMPALAAMIVHGQGSAGDD